MAFRDDRDALLARVAALETERDQLRAGADPALTRLRMRFALFAIVMVAGTAVFELVQEQARVQHQAFDDRRADELMQRLEQAQAEAAATQEQLLALQAERDAPAAEPVAPIAPIPVPQGLSLVGSVTAITGRPGVRVGTECSVDVTYRLATRDCHVSVVCAGTVLYAPPNEGFITCEVENGRVVRGHDDNPTVPSGDPRLELDVERATILVSDTPPPWSVTIRWTAPNPF